MWGGDGFTLLVCPAEGSEGWGGFGLMCPRVAGGLCSVLVFKGKREGRNSFIGVL